LRGAIQAKLADVFMKKLGTLVVEARTKMMEIETEIGQMMEVAGLVGPTMEQIEVGMTGIEDAETMDPSIPVFVITPYYPNNLF
jgi:hypothetical protein